MRLELIHAEYVNILSSWVKQYTAEESGLVFAVGKPTVVKVGLILWLFYKAPLSWFQHCERTNILIQHFKYKPQKSQHLLQQECVGSNNNEMSQWNNTYI